MSCTALACTMIKRLKQQGDNKNDSSNSTRKIHQHNWQRIRIIGEFGIRSLHRKNSHWSQWNARSRVVKKCFIDWKEYDIVLTNGSLIERLFYLLLHLIRSVGQKCTLPPVNAHFVRLMNFFFFFWLLVRIFRSLRSQSSTLTHNNSTKNNHKRHFRHIGNPTR